MSAAGAGGRTLPFAIVLFAAIFAIEVDQASPPMPLGDDAPPARFSAERARTQLARLLADETPHPVGSAANQAVKARLIDSLRDLDLSPAVQATVGCAAEHATCATVENVVAEIPGETERAIALMAHYDSVAFAPGAGDDGAGVAALLEVARIVRTERPRRNSILLVFTDAEEAGLLGAEAFFAEHPAAPRIDAVLNLEGSGSSGPTYLLRSGPMSGHLLDAFRAVAPAPFAQSVTAEIFRHMPNDTDFSVAMRARLPGIDFAFAGERNHYHTPLDTVGNLHLGTLQHHGENVLPLLRELVNADLSERAPGYVYANLGKRLWLHWPLSAGVPLAVVAIVLLAVATARVRPSPLRLLGAIGGALAVPIAAVLVTLGALSVVDRLVGVRPAWPADPWPWRLAIYGAPVLVVAALGPFLSRRLGGWTVYLGVWWISCAIAAVAAVLAPLAAYLFILPALVASLLALLAGRRETLAAPIGAVAAVVVSWFILGSAHSSESTQGFDLALAMAVPLGLLAMATLPAAASDPGRVVTLGSAGVLLLAWAMAALVEPYSADRPQHLNVAYVEQAGGADARVVVSSPDPVPARIRTAATFARERAYPWEEDEADVATVPSAGVPAPALEALEPAEAGWVRLRIVPAPGASATSLWVPRDRIEDAVRIDGRPTTMKPTQGDVTHRRVTFVAPPADGFVVEVRLRGDAPQTAYLADMRTSLPEAAERIAALRGDLAVPVHQGDLSVVYRATLL